MKLNIAFLVSSLLLLSSNTGSAEIEHEHESHAEEFEEVVVQATRTSRRMQDAALRVEVLSGHELEEKLLMRPSNISMMLNETGGLRVQVTPGLRFCERQNSWYAWSLYTTAGRRLTPIRRTSVVAWAVTGAPSDLGQIEIIKGAASSLYGGQAPRRRY